MKMKAVKQAVVALTVVFAVATVFSSCNSSGKPSASRMKFDSENSAVTLEHKGTAMGIDKAPVWLSEYFDRGIPGIEALADYKGKYCFVGEERGPGLEEVLVRANSFNTQQQIGARISTSIASVFKAHESKNPDDDSSRKYSNALNTLVNASYTGASKEGDWWLKQRISEAGKDDEIRYTAYVLYSIDRKLLDRQIAVTLESRKNGDPNLDAAFDVVIAQVLDSGLSW
jgi:hypothetical protein